MNSSGNITDISLALIGIQAELSNPVKDKIADAGKYRFPFIDLSGVIDHVRPLLEKHGLAVVQMPSTAPEGFLGMTTLLLHKSGQYIQSEHIFPFLTSETAKNSDGVEYLKYKNTQDIAGAYSSARKYALCAVLNIAAEKEEAEKNYPAANSFQGNYSNNRAPRTGGMSKSAPSPVSQAQIGKIHQLQTELEWSDEKYRTSLKTFTNKDSSKDLTAKEAHNFITYLMQQQNAT